MGKEKKIKVEKEAEVEKDTGNETMDTTDEKVLSYEEKVKYVSIIAKPLASRKMAKKIYKLIKKASKQKTYLRHGLRDVQSSIRKGETGIAIFAGDVTPIEIMCHMPAVCEENNIPYIYTPSRQDIGMAMGVKRSVLMVLIKKHEDYAELYDESYNAINAIPLPI